MCKLFTFIWCCDDVVLILVWRILFVDVNEVSEDCVMHICFIDNS